MPPFGRKNHEPVLVLDVQIHGRRLLDLDDVHGHGLECLHAGFIG
jgi:hypothetical protein